MAKFKSLTEQLGINYIQEIIKQSISYSEALRKLDCYGNSKCFYELKDFIKNNQIDILHFSGRGRVGKERCTFFQKLNKLGPMAVNDILQKVDCPSQAIRLMGRPDIGGQDFKHLKNFIIKYNLDTSHWLSMSELLSKRFKRGYMEIYGNMWRQYEKHAESRNLNFNITIEQAWQQFLKQDRKCALSGVLLNFIKESRSRNGTASLDRIDSSKGYTIDNIQWIHKDLQRMKMDMDENNFVKWCTLIAIYKN